MLLGVLGLIGVLLTIFMYISPKYRVNWYLNNPGKWEEVHLNLNGRSLWRRKDHPEFSIETQDESEEWSYGKQESWMKYPLPDPSKYTHMVHVKANGVVIYAEHFISLDGGRYFVPLPRAKYNEKEEDNEYYYNPIQLAIARVVGRFYRMEDVDEFVNHNEIEVRK